MYTLVVNRFIPRVGPPSRQVPGHPTVTFQDFKEARMASSTDIRTSEQKKTDIKTENWRGLGISVS